MKKKDILFLTLLILCLGLAGWNSFNTPKIAFVRSAIVVDKYLGMIEARKLTESKIGTWQANIDTLSLDFERSINNYQQAYRQLSSKERMERESILKRQQEKLEQYKQTMGQKAEEENEKMIQGVLNQINSFVENYSKENGYDVVLGVTMSGNILYGTEAIDITDEVLQGLNNSYKGK